jgi:uncharacterized repeat protein (TIGR03803 family)
MQWKALRLTQSAIVAFLILNLFLGAAGAQTLTVLYSFTGNQDGSFPQAGLVFDKKGNLYGTTTAGGTSGNCKNGCGTVFKLTPSGNETVLYSFTGGMDGAFPSEKLVLDARGNLYGTTIYGGNAQCNVWFQYTCGTVFKVTPAGQETVLYRFTGGKDGGNPMASVVLDAKGNLYGTTFEGGAGTCPGNCGTVFKVTPRGKETVLHSFNRADGAYPEAGLVFDKKGNLYGTTAAGGKFQNAGTVFKLTPSGKETVLHSFPLGFTTTDGAQPRTGLVFDKKGNLYGTTLRGGDRGCSGGAGFGCGVVFKVTPSDEDVIYTFTGGPDGAYPSDLVLDASGNMYGTTPNGGVYGLGTVFKVTPTGQETILHTFNGFPADGAYPEAGLVWDANGNLYGTSGVGGAYGYGTVFKLVP